jgi:hypothetical protein
VLPVDVVEAKTADFAGPQPVDGEEEEDRAVPDIDRLVRSRILDEAADVLPEGPSGSPCSR